MMHMDVLRCQTPDMVRKEIWAHLLAYNLIRTVIAQAAARHGTVFCFSSNQSFPVLELA